MGVRPTLAPAAASLPAACLLSALGEGAGASPAAATHCCWAHGCARGASCASSARATRTAKSLAAAAAGLVGSRRAAYGGLSLTARRLLRAVSSSAAGSASPFAEAATAAAAAAAAAAGLTGSPGCAAASGLRGRLRVEMWPGDGAGRVWVPSSLASCSCGVEARGRGGGGEGVAHDVGELVAGGARLGGCCCCCCVDGCHHVSG